MEIPTIYKAGNYVKRLFDLKFVRRFQGAFGVISLFYESPKGQIYAVVLIDEFFHSFSYVFPQCKGMGWGNSANYNLLKAAAAENANLLYVRKKSGEVYAVSAKEVLEFAEEHKTIRELDNQIECGNQLHASYPIRMLTKIYPKEEEKNA